MANKIDKLEIVNRILGGEIDQDTDEEELIDLLLTHTVANSLDRHGSAPLTIGQRVADKIAKVAGSWSFIFSFLLILTMWIGLNGVWFSRAFDPYPFILLNLILSCIAALQAPVIMMSQNRQEQKDRIRGENDYKVNLKSEIIVKDLHEKLERLIANQEAIINRLAALDHLPNNTDAQ